MADKEIVTQPGGNGSYPLPEGPAVPTEHAALGLLLGLLRNDYRLFGEGFCEECLADYQPDGTYQHKATCPVGIALAAHERGEWS